MALTIAKTFDTDLDFLRGKRVAIVGYGNQGRAHALNLRDSGAHVIVGQRAGASADRASMDRFEPLSIATVAAQAELIILTLPDESAADIYSAEIAASMRAGKTLGFVHGFNIRFEFIRPPKDVDVVMIAPKGPGTLLRSLYLEGKGLPSLMAIHRDASGNARRMALAWAAAIGSARAAVVESTFADETETDLFGEQAVLCGGVIELCKAAVETLVSAGYEPEFAYLECVHELKQVIELVYARGIGGMYKAISNTAEYGALTRGPKMVSEECRAEMRRLLEEIRSGTFAREWIGEYRAGGKRFQGLRNAVIGMEIERAGSNVRALMPWLDQGKSDSAA